MQTKEVTDSLDLPQAAFVDGAGRTETSLAPPEPIIKLFIMLFGNKSNAGCKGLEVHVDNERNVIAVFDPGGAVADGNAADTRSPCLGHKGVINVIAPICAVPEIIGGASFLSLQF